MAGNDFNYGFCDVYANFQSSSGSYSDQDSEVLDEEWIAALVNLLAVIHEGSDVLRRAIDFLAVLRVDHPAIACAQVFLNLNPQNNL
ncbi:MAG: hypothetical protein DCC68_21035 [Planctomycetota bacterium]|nr:MAG: hypothetical protein DCC68_21035 [Planctomycetota bacterium]